MASSRDEYGVGPERIHGFSADERTVPSMAAALLRVQLTSPELRLPLVTLGLAPVVAWWAAGWGPAIGLGVALLSMPFIMRRGLEKQLRWFLPAGGRLVTEFSDTVMTVRSPTSIRHFPLATISLIRPIGRWVVFSQEGSRDYHVIPAEVFPDEEIDAARRIREDAIF